MISYKTIIKAKKGDKKAISSIVEYYLPIIKSYSKNEEFIQIASLEILEGTKRFKNRKQKK